MGIDLVSEAKNNKIMLDWLRMLPENWHSARIAKDETIWLTQKAMAELFGCSTDNISLHLKNIYKDAELLEEATTEDFSVVQKEGSREVSRKLTFYNLDAIISVGYRVNSAKATQFRIWATNILKEYMIKDLEEKEIRQLERTITGYFDYIEDLIERENTFNMAEFAKSVNEFLAFRKYDILPDNNKGKISMKQAQEKASAEYDKYNKTQKIESDFDREIKQLIHNQDLRQIQR